MFFFNDDVVLFISVKDRHFPFMARTVGDSVLISAAGAALAVAWSQPGQVAPVTLHRPGQTKHCVSVEQLALQGTKLALSP